jgi:CDP-glycerol glycerophosphotransferase (TagB/SpsB family)
LWDFLQEGDIPEDQATEILEYMRSAKKNQKKIKFLEDKTSELEAGDGCLTADEDEEYALLNMRQNFLESKLRLLETPALR